MKPVTRLAAAVNYRDTELGVFDPLIAFCRLRDAFPCVEKFGGDHLEETAIKIVELNKGEGVGAVRIALRDLMSRGPALRFRIPRGDGSFYTGIADRQKIQVSSDEPFADDFREQFEAFLTSLKLPDVLVTSE